MEIEKIKFSKLTWQIKVGVVGGWIALALYALSFTVGFFMGLVE